LAFELKNQGANWIGIEFRCRKARMAKWQPLCPKSVLELVWKLLEIDKLKT